MLTKMDRNTDIDRVDAKFLATSLHLESEIFRTRYLNEFRPIFVGNTATLDVTFELWMEAYFGTPA
jgi:hypothetical protein